MNGSHWADEWVAWLRSITPEVGSTPIYIRLFSEADGSGIDTSDCVGCTHANFDLRLQCVLMSRDRWAGRGIVILLRDDFHEWSRDDQHSVLLHEFAHACESWDDPWRRPLEQFSGTELMFLIPGGRKKLIEAWADEIVALPGGSELLALARNGGDQRLCHGSQFVRAGLHLWHRSCGQVLLRDCTLTGRDYVLPDSQLEAARIALDDELRSGGDLFAVLRTEPPVEYSKLFR